MKVFTGLFCKFKHACNEADNEKYHKRDSSCLQICHNGGLLKATADDSKKKPQKDQTS